MKNAFDYSGPSKIGQELEQEAKLRRAGSKMVEKLRKAGKEPMYIVLNKKRGADKLAKDVALKDGRTI